MIGYDTNLWLNNIETIQKTQLQISDSMQELEIDDEKIYEAMNTMNATHEDDSSFDYVEEFSTLLQDSGEVVDYNIEETCGEIENLIR